MLILLFFRPKLILKETNLIRNALLGFNSLANDFSCTDPITTLLRLPVAVVFDDVVGWLKNMNWQILNAEKTLKDASSLAHLINLDGFKFSSCFQVSLLIKVWDRLVHLKG